MRHLNFKQFIEADNKKNSAIKDFIGNGKLILFFKNNDEIFGAPEESRVVFARLKTPSEDEPDDGNFAAINLNKAISGEMTRSMFGSSDLDNIKVLDQDCVISLLAKMAEKLTNLSLPQLD